MAGRRKRLGCVYQKQVTRPMPTGAELFTRKGEQQARWTDGRGQKRTAKTTTGRDGTLRIVEQSATYTAKYRDGNGLVREVSTGCRSRDGAESVLKNLTDRAEKVIANVLSSAEAATADHQHTPLSDHVDEYLINLEARGTTANYRAEIKRRLNRLAVDCKSGRLADLDTAVVEKWLVARMADGQMGSTTRNMYRTSLIGFGNWCVTTGRLSSNPYTSLPTADEKTDRRRQRRAMTEAELQRLLYVSRLRPLAEIGRETVRVDPVEPTDKKKRSTWRKTPLTYDTIEAAAARARKTLTRLPQLFRKWTISNFFSAWILT